MWQNSSSAQKVLSCTNAYVFVDVHEIYNPPKFDEEVFLSFSPAYLDEYFLVRYFSSQASVRCIPYLEGNEAEDDDLDDFMLNYCSILESYHEETQTLLKQAVTNLDFFEQKLFKLQNFGATKLQTCCGSSDTAPSGVEAPEGQTIGNYGVSIYDDVQSSLTRNRTTKSVVDELQDKILTPEEEYQILHQLKAEAIFDLKDEFLKRKKKGKLPQDAAAALKEWWQQNFVWPYPSDDDKKALADSTSLSLTQVNNW
eukprot:gene16156-19165_t